MLQRFGVHLIFYWQKEVDIYIYSDVLCGVETLNMVRAAQASSDSVFLAQGLVLLLILFI